MQKHEMDIDCWVSYFQNRPAKTYIYIVYSFKESGYWSNLETYDILSKQQHFTETTVVTYSGR